ncbi:hypothetical protein ACOTHJ_15065 [Achromobacter xylosoxidans]
MPSPEPHNYQPGPEINDRLKQAYAAWIHPDNDGSGFSSFGETIALNEGSRVFNAVMAQTGDTAKAEAASEVAISTVQGQANRFLAQQQ